jgi:hypothetical protein
MSKIILKNSKNNIEEIDISDVLHFLYFKLYIVPTLSEIELYNNENNTNYQSEKIIEIISSISTQLPLFDIVSYNIYLISEENVYYYVKEKHYRLPNQEILDFMLSKKEKIISEKVKKQIIKNITFIKNYNFEILFNTYLHVIYKNSNQIGKNITFCHRSSFLQYASSPPYYTRSEIINMALNLNLIKSDMTVYTPEKIQSLCKIVEDNDINALTLLKHQLYIQKNYAQHIIYYYTFYGSLYYNRYIRSDSIYDPYINSKINDLFKLIKKAPAFEKDHIVYRFISNDNYLSDVKINGTYTENSFISTSRNPFYEPKNNVFGNILIKIKLPKNKSGIGLCLENYSLFTNEQEILLAPGKLKLISVDDNFKYFHPDIKAQKAIKKKYEFIYIDSLDEIQSKPLYNPIKIDPLPDNFTLIDSDLNDKLIEFFRSTPIINDMHYFKWLINEKEYIFQVFNLEKVIAYYKYFYLQKKEHSNNEDLIFLILQDEKTQEINLIIEISEIISVNYLHKFTGANTINDNEIIIIVNKLLKLFNINTAIIHPKYKKYNTSEKIDDLDNEKIEFYYNENIINYAKDLTFYNNDIWNYIIKKGVRFNNIEENNEYSIINKNNIYSLDSFRRLSPEIILNINDNDELYKIYTKNKKNNIYEYLIFLHENYFNYIPLLLDKLTKKNILKSNPFIQGYYVMVKTSEKNNIDKIDSFLKIDDEDNTRNVRRIKI